MHNNILLTSVSGKVRLVKAMTNATLGKRVKIFGYDMHDLAVALKFCHKGFVLPQIDYPNFFEELLKVCELNEIGYIIPTSERDLIFFSSNEKKLLKNNIRLIASDAESIEICTSKVRFHNFCVSRSLPVPRKVENLVNAVFPCVIKKEISQASRGVYIAHDSDEAKKIISKIDGKFLIQEFNSGEEYSIDAFYDRRGKLIGAIPRKRDVISDGEAIVTTSKNIPCLIEIAEQLGEEFRFYGHVVIQAFLTDGQAELIEVNPRFGGASSLSFYCGLRSSEWIVNDILGIDDGRYHAQFKYNVRMMKYSDDLFFELND